MASFFSRLVVAAERWLEGRPGCQIFGGQRRSGAWPRIRAEWLVENPCCEACGGMDSLEVHHVVPFHERPDLELCKSNLMTLCESGPGGMNCHLVLGHRGNWKLVNPGVRLFAAKFRRMLEGLSV